MNVTCPSCMAVFRVDPAKIPAAGVRARCSECGGLIGVDAAAGDDFLDAPLPDPASGGDAAALRSPSAEGTGTVPSPGLPGVQTRGEVGGGGTPGNGGGLPAEAAPLSRRASAAAEGAEATPGGLQHDQPAAVTDQGPDSALGDRPARAAGDSAFRLRVDDAEGTGTVHGSLGAGHGMKPTPAESHAAPPPRLPTPPRGVLARPSVVPRASDTLDRPRSGPTTVVATPSTGPSITPADAGGVPEHARGERAAADWPAANAAAASAPRRAINPFLSSDPHQRARRLARALVSDMIAYHPQKRDEGLRAGTLPQLFREEIKKSYEQYVEQVGREFARDTNHFREALNEILAGGSPTF